MCVRVSFLVWVSRVEAGLPLTGKRNSEEDNLLGRRENASHFGCVENERDRSCGRSQYICGLLIKNIG